MHEFAVWVPGAKKVAVKVGDAPHAMEGPNERGWWKAAVADAGPGTDYGFLLDDGSAVYPDPRSLWQPNGVHAQSRVYDHTAFVWSD